MSKTLTHIAGPRLTIDGRVIQRCMLCGAKLCDSAGSMSISTDGRQPEFPTWPVDALVQVEVGNPTRYSVLPESDLLPKDSCIDFA